MKTTEQLERLMAPASLRSAWLMRRACRPMCGSPISPSISALGTSAATESTTTTSTAPERTRISQISSPCSPVSGWDTSRLSTSTPSFFVYSTSSACSASMYPAARDAANPDRRIQVDRPSGDRVHPHPRRVGAHPHDGALAAGLLDLGDRKVE